MDIATVSTKGQLVIPRRYRTALHLMPGDKVVFDLKGESLILRREKPSRAKLAMGKFGRPVLKARAASPPMTPERVKAILDEDE